MTDLDLRREILERRQRLLTESNRIIEQINACDIMLQTLGESEQQTKMPFIQPVAKNGNTPVSEMVNEAILSLPNELSIFDVMGVIKMRHPEAMPDKQTVASVFWRTAKERQFKVLKKGGGRRPTIYSKK